jgi:hypothetical protein
MTIRGPEDDKRKNANQLKHQIENKLTCTLEWCDRPLTMFRGPGDKRLCREHQLQQREYGGLGRYDRPHSFSREWTCSWCGYSPKDDPWFDNPPLPWDNEAHKIRAQRSMLIGDHGEIRKADGGSDDKDNVQTLCRNCDAKKTVLHKDYQRSKYKEVEQGNG